MKQWMDIVLQLQKIFQLIVLTPRRRNTYTFVFSTISIACVKHAPWECMLLRICVPSALDIYTTCIMYHILYFPIVICVIIFYYYYYKFLLLLNNCRCDEIWVHISNCRNLPNHGIFFQKLLKTSKKIITLPKLNLN